MNTLQELLPSLSRHPPDGCAILVLNRDTASTWKRGDLIDSAARLANGLHGRGVKPGSYVAIVAPPSPEWILACLAVLRTGATLVPVDAQFNEEVLQHVLSDSHAELILTTRDRQERIERVDLEGSPRLVLLDDDEGVEQDWRSVCSDERNEFPEVDVDEPAVLFYTSGTTGPPKGVPLSHRNLLFQIRTLTESDLTREDDRVLLPLPLHHVYPFTAGLLAPLKLGLPIVLPYSLTGPQVLRALNEGDVTVVIGVPRLYEALYSGIESQVASRGRLAKRAFNLLLAMSERLTRRLGTKAGKTFFGPIHRKTGRRLRLLTSGGSALDAGLARKLQGLGWQVATGYGLTETSPLLTIDRPGELHPGTVGRPVKDVELRIGNSDGVGDGRNNRDGEILARGPGVFNGYHNLPEKTREVLSDDGWFRTGDLGYFDESKRLHVTGRVSTMIVTEAGENIQPDSLEEAYAKSPAIREIGILQQGGRLAALVVPEPGEVGTRDADNLQQTVQEEISRIGNELPSYQRPGEVVVTRDPLPRTRLGKLRRHKLGDRFEQSSAGGEESSQQPIAPDEMSPDDRNLLEQPPAGRAWELLTEKFPDRRLTPDSALELDLGIDSLEWLNLTLELRHRVGVEFTEEAIGRMETVRDLLEEASSSSVGAGDADPLEQPEEVLSDEQKRWLEPLGSKGKAVARAQYTINRRLMRTLFGVQTLGREHLPETGPYILAPNHVSHLDPFAIGAALPPERLADLYWGGWTGAAFGNVVTRFVSRHAQVVPVDPDGGPFSSLAFAAALLKRRKNLVWFPEGERSPTGELQEFQSGIGMLIERFHPVVIPVWIEGAHSALPRGGRLPRLHRITVTFGTPIEASELLGGADEDRRPEQIAGKLRDRLVELQTPHSNERTPAEGDT